MRTLLGVWAHPDDEAYLSAGLMAAARSGGDRVVVATATRGELGGDPHVRARELRTSLAALDVHEHVWLGFADGGCAAAPPALGTAAVRRVIDAVRPDAIVTFGPDGITGHPDHRAVSSWTTMARRAAGARARLLYATLTPAFHAQWGGLCDELGMFMTDERPRTPEREVDLTLRCTGSVLEQKEAALLAHASQTDGLRARVGDDTFRDMWVTEWFVDGDRLGVRTLSA
jgi:LmbE family N-acetylglucosaminyl deacetylase